MQLAGAIIGVLAGLLGGIWGGYKLGEHVRGNPREYWTWNAVAFVVCVLLDMVGLALGWHWLAVSALGLLAGLITGMKYGYSESIGIWKMFDTWTGGDADLRPPVDDAGPTDDGMPGPEQGVFRDDRS